jgi:glycosyltransferase involved in cell wall biosynthesis
MAPLSVIIPTLNEEKYAPLLLESLKGRELALDIIVVDAHSTDATAHVVERFANDFTGKSSLRFVRAPRRGISAQRNYGATLAKHPLFLFLDADVIVPPQALEVMVSLFERRELTIASTRIVPPEPDFRGSLIYGLGAIFQRAMLLRGEAYFAGSCTMCTREVFEKIGGYDEHLLVGEDIDFSLKAGHLGPAALLPIALAVSTRRFKKYGYWHVFSQWFVGISRRLLGLAAGSASHDYEFGAHD